MRAAVLITGVLLLAPSGPAQQDAERSDWKPIAAILGASGTVLADGTFRIDVPRTEPELRNEFGFVVPPSMVLTYAAFTGTPERALVVGDTCTLPEGVNPVIDALRAGGIEVVAVHNHMLGGDPNFVFVHFQGEGAPPGMAKAIRAAWDAMGKQPPPEAPASATPPAPDWKAVSDAMGLPGALQADGMFKIGLPRPTLGTKFGDRSVPAGVGLGCWVGFAPCACGRTMMMGDTCLLRGELQPAIDAYRKRGIRIVAIHNHLFGTEPELMFCHFAAEGDALVLARAVREVWAPLRAK